MAISGSLKNHTHVNEYFHRPYGTWQAGQDTVLKFPDGTMIQTKSVEFGPGIVQPKWYERAYIRWNGNKNEYNWTINNNTRNEKGYSHERQYFVDWKVPFKWGTTPTIFQHYEVDGQWAQVDRFFPIISDKTSNSRICFFHFDPGGEQDYVRVTFLGIGLWK